MKDAVISVKYQNKDYNSRCYAFVNGTVKLSLFSYKWDVMIRHNLQVPLFLSNICPSRKHKQMLWWYAQHGDWVKDIFHANIEM